MLSICSNADENNLVRGESVPVGSEVWSGGIVLKKSRNCSSL